MIKRNINRLEVETCRTKKILSIIRENMISYVVLKII